MRKRSTYVEEGRGCGSEGEEPHFLMPFVPALVLIDDVSISTYLVVVSGPSLRLCALWAPGCL